MVFSRASGATDEIPHDLAEAERTVDRHCTRPPTDAAGVL